MVFRRYVILVSCFFAFYVLSQKHFDFQVARDIPKTKLINNADDTAEERKFIIKLDLIVVPYAVLAYWVKYIGSKPSLPDDSVES